MNRHVILAAALLAGLSSAPAFAAGDAAAGLKAMKETNLIVLTDLTAGHDVEGTVFVGRDLKGAGTFGKGNSSQGQATSSAPILFVGHDNLAAFNDIHVQNRSNGGAGNLSTGSSAFVGRNAQIMELQDPNRTLWVGGNLASGGNYAFKELLLGGNLAANAECQRRSGGVIKIGGSLGSGANVNANGATYVHPAAGLQTQLTSDAAARVTKMGDDVKALSTTLAALTPGNSALADFNAASHTLTLNAASGSAGYAVFNIDGALLSSSTYTELVYNFASTSPAVIVNVSGLAINFHLNPTGTSAANNQQIIWNFFQATDVDVTTMLHGSVLAPYAELTNTTPIEGSVVAKSFIQGGEVHLGTYDLGLPTPPPPAVPEPASWAMMIMGLGLIGAAQRYRMRLRFA